MPLRELFLLNTPAEEMVALWNLCGIINRLLGLNTEFLVGQNRLTPRRTRIGTMKHFMVANLRKQRRD